MTVIGIRDFEKQCLVQHHQQVAQEAIEDRRLRDRRRPVPGLHVDGTPEYEGITTPDPDAELVEHKSGWVHEQLVPDRGADFA